MNSKFFILSSIISAIFLVSLVSFVSAQAVSDQTSNISIIATPHTTTVNFTLNGAGQSWDTQVIPSSYYSSVHECSNGISFSASDLLNGVDASGSVNSGVVSFSSVSVENADSSLGV